MSYEDGHWGRWSLAVIPGLEFSNIFGCNVTYLPDGSETRHCTKEQIDQQMQAIEAATPVSAAMQGAIGTLITSLVVAAIGGIFLRKR